MRTLGVRVFTEDHNRFRFHYWRELNDGHERVAGYAVAHLLTCNRTRVEIEDDSHVSRCAGYREAGFGIAERFFTIGMAALDAVHVTPGDFPSAERLLQIGHRFFQHVNRIAIGFHHAVSAGWNL